MVHEVLLEAPFPHAKSDDANHADANEDSQDNEQHHRYYPQEGRTLTTRCYRLYCYFKRLPKHCLLVQNENTQLVLILNIHFLLALHVTRIRLVIVGDEFVVRVQPNDLDLLIDFFIIRHEPFNCKQILNTCGGVNAPVTVIVLGDVAVFVCSHLEIDTISVFDIGTGHVISKTKVLCISAI